METATPMLKQYQEIKSQHPGCILFFRLGDFYEMFGEDARIASGILDLVLTSRDAGKSGRVPMCGLPYHAAEGYIAKLIKAGRKVAICEQLEDPALAKGIVKRDVIRIITSGTYIDDATFESRTIISLFRADASWGLAFTDTSSGIIQANEYPSPEALTEALSRIQPFEIVFPQSQEQEIKELFARPLLRTKHAALSSFDDWCFNTDMAQKSLCEHFHTHNLKGFGLEDKPAAVAASGALLEYLTRMHKQPLRHLHKISLFSDDQFVYVSPAAVFGLDLPGLLSSIDHTLTSLGKRLLKDWIWRPLQALAPIKARQEAIEALRAHTPVREQLQELLRNIPDIEKCISRISCGIGSPRDLLALRNTLLKQPDISRALAALSSAHPLLTLTDVLEIRTLLERSVSPSIPLAHPEGHVINQGFHAELDSLRDIRENGRQWLKKFQEREISRSGISSLKVGFNQVFGYYIEISKANLEKTPADYIRRQTLANGERYITAELKEYEDKILNAEGEILRIEKELIAGLFQKILDASEALHAFCAELARLDVLQSLAQLSLRPGYILPALTETTELCIKDGRHPVVEKLLAEPFIPNDTLLDSTENHLVILTGPNMAGKSTYIRQTALLTLLAQTGSFIPAASASIGLVDKVFTRIGAHDEITKGQSTFMVEMSETAGILNNATSRSLVVLDEIGRGTSTFDGLSLAWAISEFLAGKRIRTLFATHFHELTALAEEHPGVKNYNVSVKEWNDQVIFLHKIIPGGTDDSYGIYVAKLAGIPQEVVRHAEKILTRLELNNNLQERIRSRVTTQEQLSLFNSGADPAAEALKKEIQELDVDGLSPREALTKLQELKEKLNSHERN